MEDLAARHDDKVCGLPWKAKELTMNDVLIFLMGSMCGASVGMFLMAIVFAAREVRDG